MTLILLAVLIGAFNLPKIDTASFSRSATFRDSIWRHPNLVLASIGIFTYVGAEVSIGSFLVNYFESPDIAGLSAITAASFVSFYWGGAMVGRFLGAGLLRRYKSGNLLAICAIFAAGLVVTSMSLSGRPAMWTILAVGFFNSIMFPTILSLGVAELGTLTGNGSGILNLAIVGGAVLPLLQGFIADKIGIHHAFVLPVICYLYILYFGLSGSKPNSERYATLAETRLRERFGAVFWPLRACKRLDRFVYHNSIPSHKTRRYFGIGYTFVHWTSRLRSGLIQTVRSGSVPYMGLL